MFLSLFLIQIMSNIIYMKWKRKTTIANKHVRIIETGGTYFPPYPLTMELTVDFSRNDSVACVLCTCIFAKKYVSQIRKKKMFFSSQVLKEKKKTAFVLFLLIF